MLPPIIKTGRADLPAEEVFEFFTLGIGDWWPVETHSVAANSGALPLEVHFETQPEGRIYEVLPDGGLAQWGQVLIWNAPTEVVFTWHPGRDPSQATRIALRLASVAAHTEIELAHDGWEALGQEADIQHSQYDPGWDFVFGECFLGKLA
ncbi:SRPBCC domain-containing protein [Aliiroseovarius sp. KMU-50]|uniref:SRPBCC domain-containing protein n=1 Tax=Aliiroseovarius salicola TaxID=3009082 RepID=A0ABT4W0J5_9RHOB|nr:SRPBCC domain-containing protein [Aliiroseovarius sp. KMU-50]MDA5093520.1 SRPBCC domain-containing protein [Aliiroseovarius sp. KMU-50]